MISICINLDTRAAKNIADGLFSGTSNLDYLTDGVYNKQLFFSGFEFETIVFIDEHLPVPDDILEYLRRTCDVVIIRKHTDEISFNDYNYLTCLSAARGDIICHVDQDTACFAYSKENVEELIRQLEKFKFVSYPSHWSPKAVNDPSFGNRTWASTRFFLCKKEAIKFDELRKCIEEPEYGYDKYGDSPRRCNWLEHFLTLTNDDSCHYPKMEIDKHLIFSWGSYERWTLRRLNEMKYDEVKDWVKNHPIVYPNDIYC